MSESLPVGGHAQLGPSSRSTRRPDGTIPRSYSSGCHSTSWRVIEARSSRPASPTARAVDRAALCGVCATLWRSDWRSTLRRPLATKRGVGQSVIGQHSRPRLAGARNLSYDAAVVEEERSAVRRRPGAQTDGSTPASAKEGCGTTVDRCRRRSRTSRPPPSRSLVLGAAAASYQACGHGEGGLVPGGRPELEDLTRLAPMRKSASSSATRPWGGFFFFSRGNQWTVRPAELGQISRRCPERPPGEPAASANPPRERTNAFFEATLRPCRIFCPGREQAGRSGEALAAAPRPTVYTLLGVYGQEILCSRG